MTEASRKEYAIRAINRMFENGKELTDSQLAQDLVNKGVISDSYKALELVRTRRYGNPEKQKQL